MKHSFLDKYSDLGSLVHRLDPRAKIISFLIYILFVISTLPTDFVQFAIYSAIIFIVISISRVPFGHVFRRSLIIVPSVLLIAVFIPFFKKDQIGGGYNLGVLHLTVSYSGLWILWNVLIKSWLATLAMIVLSSTTKFSMLLRGLESLWIPRILIMLLSFMYRYIFVLVNEAMRMERARNSRYFGGEYLRQIKVIGNIIGLLFIRAYERGERVYQSMVSRGFDGETRTVKALKLLSLDVWFCVVFLGTLIAVKIGSVL